MDSANLLVQIMLSVFNWTFSTLISVVMPVDWAELFLYYLSFCSGVLKIWASDKEWICVWIRSYCVYSAFKLFLKKRTLVLQLGILGHMFVSVKVSWWVVLLVFRSRELCHYCTLCKNYVKYKSPKENFATKWCNIGRTPLCSKYMKS